MRPLTSSPLAEEGVEDLARIRAREGGNEGIKEIVHLKLGEMDGVT